MTEPARRSGIVLAGGRSKRFGADKLGATIEGRPILHLTIAALAAVCTDITVVVGQGGTPDLPSDLHVTLRLVEDDERDAGPLAALIPGLEAAPEPDVLLVAGDLPALVPEVLRALAEAIRAGAPDDAAVLLDADRLRPVPAAVRRDPALAAVRRLRADGVSRLRSLFEVLRTGQIPEATWRSLDPDGATLLDVDVPEDLAIAAAAIRRSAVRSREASGGQARRATMFRRT